MDGATSNTASVSEASPAAVAVSRRRKRIRYAIMFGVPVIALGWFGWTTLTAGRYQETDNAYVKAARTAVSSSVTGRIVEMRVADNQRVKAGEILFLLDTGVLQADVELNEAALAAARSRVASLKADYQGKLVAVEAARERQTFAASELARAEQLGVDGIASRQQVEAARHALQQADADLTAARQAAATSLANLGGDPRVDPDAHFAVLEATARLERARLALSYTKVIAPQDGIVTKVDQVEVGSFVNPGQTLFWIVSGEPWIEANFKENQIAHMREGQLAAVKIDALGDTEVHARVGSFSPGTGAAFSALPAQNATGNWVKVVQRVPVRLELIDVPAGVNLVAGLSAHVTVDTQSAQQPDR